MEKRQHLKQRKLYIDGLINTIENDTEYQEFFENECNKELIENNQVWESIIYESFDNKAMNKLIKKFTKLNPKKYKVNLNYRAKTFKNLNYFSLQYTHSSTIYLGEIKFLDDKYIKGISALFTQVNNNQAVVEFKIDFKQIMNNEMFFDFIKDNKEQLINKRFIGYCNIQDLGHEFIYNSFNELVKLALQAKLMEIAELKYGVKYKLPSMMVINYPKGQYNQEFLRNIFLSKTYEIRNGEQHLITNLAGEEGLEMELYFSGNSFSSLSFINILSSYRMDFYYFLFDGIEKIELNQKMNKYFNESKSSISSNDYKWLVNKIRGIKDNKIHPRYNESDKCGVKDWKAFYDGEVIEIDFTNKKYKQMYETIYTECLEHIKVLYAVGKENLIINIAIVTLITTLIGIVITIAITG